MDPNNFYIRMNYVIKSFGLSFNNNNILQSFSFNLYKENINGLDHNNLSMAKQI